jgi:hypothetical protein
VTGTTTSAAALIRWRELLQLLRAEPSPATPQRLAARDGYLVGMGMGRVDPLDPWPGPKYQGRWASRVGLIQELGQRGRHLVTHWVNGPTHVQILESTSIHFYLLIIASLSRAIGRKKKSHVELDFFPMLLTDTSTHWYLMPLIFLF